VNRAIWRIFREHGVRIPVPQQETRLLDSRQRPPSPLPPAQLGLDQQAD
jgi:small-conductance mechanosensitive channel